MSRSVTVAQPRMYADVAANAAEHARIIEEAPAGLVVFPELSLTGYTYDAAAVPSDSPHWGPIVAACASRGSVALVGAVVEDELGRAIATVRVDRSGPQVVYRKVALTSADAASFVPGTGPAVIDVDGLQVGVAICMDIWTDAYLGAYAARPMDVFVASLLSPGGEEDEAHTRGATLARTFGVPVAFAQYAGPNPLAAGEDACGHSAIYAPDTDPDTAPADDPSTVILAEASAEPGQFVSAHL